MHIPHVIRHFALPAAAAVLLVACAGGASAGWTYAPLGPTPSAPASVAPSPGASGSPSASGGPGVTVDLSTPADSPLAFVPSEFTVPAGASVTVNYANESSLPHNVNVFAGADSSSESLGASDIINQGETTTMGFTAPSEAGDYFFWCDVHGASMVGTYHVE